MVETLYDNLLLLVDKYGGNKYRMIWRDKLYLIWLRFFSLIFLTSYLFIFLKLWTQSIQKVVCNLGNRYWNNEMPALYPSNWQKHIPIPWYPQHWPECGKRGIVCHRWKAIWQILVKLEICVCPLTQHFHGRVSTAEEGTLLHVHKNTCPECSLRYSYIIYQDILYTCSHMTVYNIM